MTADGERTARRPLPFDTQCAVQHHQRRTVRIALRRRALLSELDADHIDFIQIIIAADRSPIGFFNRSQRIHLHSEFIIADSLQSDLIYYIL